MTARTRKLLLAIALLGLGASLISTFVHYTLLTDPTYTSFCDVSASVSCTQAYLSKYGQLPGRAGRGPWCDLLHGRPVDGGVRTGAARDPGWKEGTRG